MAEQIDLDNLPKISHTKVSVNGKKTPLQIGDKVPYFSEDCLYKTVISITVCEDGRIVYTLEWAGLDGELKQESVTLTELKILADHMSQRIEIAGLRV